MDPTTTAAFSKCHDVLKGGGEKMALRDVFLFAPAAKSSDTLGFPSSAFSFCRGLDRPPPPVGLLPRRSLTAASRHSEMSGGGEAANWPGISAEHH